MPLSPCRRALAGSASDSLTSRLHKFTLQGEGPDSVRFRLWDTAGWTPAKSEACLAACAALLDGRLAHGADMAQPPADEGWEVHPARITKPEGLVFAFASPPWSANCRLASCVLHACAAATLPVAILPCMQPQQHAASHLPCSTDCALAAL